MTLLNQAFTSPVYKASAIALAFIILTAITGLFYTPHDPLALSIDKRLLAPSLEHLMGTDHFGRDVFSRLLVGAGVSLKVSLLTIGFALFLGVVLGASAGYFGGFIDRIISGVIDAFLAMPGILLALALISVLGTSLSGVVIALGFAYTPNIARVVRGKVLSLRQSAFIEAARLFRHPHWFIIVRHIIPNVTGPITVLASSYFAQALLSESVLSFLGLGVPPPHPSWGGLLAESQKFVADAPWLSLFPGLAIVITLLSINLVGDALRDYLDPKQ